MAWTEVTYPHLQLHDAHSMQTCSALQQPTTILQQLPAAMMAPGSAPSIRTSGHVKEDLVDMMMIQNAQMHQVIMNNMTMSALSLFGYNNNPPPRGPETSPAQVTIYPVMIQEDAGENEEIHYHHYQPAPYLSYPAWFPQNPQATLVYQDTIHQAQQPVPSASPHRERRAVPPPPPPSATGTVGADVPPATEYYNATERR